MFWGIWMPWKNLMMGKLFGLQLVNDMENKQKVNNELYHDKNETTLYQLNTFVKTLIV